MEAALFTPSTLKLIKQSAPTKPARDLAHDLGWDVPRLQRIARAHGIELVHGAADAVVPPLAEQASRFDPQRDLKGLSVDDIAQRVPPKQAQLIVTLRRFNGKFVSGPELSTFMGGTVKSINATAKQARENLASGNADITVDSGPLGYRLIAAKVSIDAPPAPVRPRRAINATMSLDEVIAELAAGHALLMRALKPTLQTGEYVRVAKLSEIDGRGRSNQAITHSVSYLKKRLDPSRFYIESSTGRNGGYRLAVWEE